MERRGVYRKGSAGHARNASSFRIYREHFKRWRVTLTAFLAFALLLSTAPQVGDQFKASLLSVDEASQLSQMSAQDARKTLLNELHVFVNDCATYALDECKAEGDALLANLASGEPETSAMLRAVEDFVLGFETDLALMACRYELAEAVNNLKKVENSLSQFQERYGEMLSTSVGQQHQKRLQQTRLALTTFVESCAAR